MSEKPISEKASEILFNRYLLQTFRLGEASIYAPSSREEFKDGYDSKLTGSSSFHELYLQFKSPSYSENGQRFTIHVSPHQDGMLRQYPLRTAYYLAHTFSSLKEFMDAQRGVRTSVDFLRHFVAIQISSLPDDSDITFFQYIKAASNRGSPRIKYKLASDGNIRIAPHDIVGEGWLWGNQLAEKFKENSIGVLVQLLGDGDFYSITPSRQVSELAMKGPIWQMTPEKAQSIANNRVDADFGIQIRK